MAPNAPQCLPDLLRSIRACTACADLPLGPRPILQASETARILIAGQAPGQRAHIGGIPFADASGQRLRAWLGLADHVFYDSSRVAIAPMGFCFPGTGASGDMPPRPQCAALWRERLLERLAAVRLTLVIGSYATAWHLPGDKRPLTALARDWQCRWPELVVLPHPSPRNNRWLKANPWFEEEVLPPLRRRVAELIG